MPSQRCRGCSFYSNISVRMDFHGFLIQCRLLFSNEFRMCSVGLWLWLWFYLTFEKSATRWVLDCCGHVGLFSLTILLQNSNLTPLIIIDIKWKFLLLGLNWSLNSIWILANLQKLQNHRTFTSHNRRPYQQEILDIH